MRMKMRLDAKWTVAVLGMLAVGVLGQAATVPIYTRGNVLVGANFNDGPGSSDMTLIMRLHSGTKVYVDEGAPVKYVHDPDNKDVKPGWTKIEYDDKAWKDGESGVGFSDGDDNTDVGGGRISIWTRYKPFDIADASTIKELILLADYDDQYAAWLNGVQVASSNPALAPADKEPAWNASQGGAGNRGSCEMVKGKPNKDRWNCARVVKTTIDFKFAGPSALAVEPQGKMAALWGGIKRR
jgi:hypothetical protein